MCIIISRPPGTHVKSRYLKNAWEGNSDGAGIMFIHDNKVIVQKGLMTLKDFMEAWRMIPETTPTVAHFRIRTSGLRDANNTHPFEIFPGALAMVHNGMLPIKEVGDMSDTATFVELVLKRLGAGFHKNLGLQHMLDVYCGSHNKLVFLDSKGRLTYVNEDKGVVDEGVWYSNYTFRGWSRHQNVHNTGGYQYTDEDDGAWNESTWQAGYVYDPKTGKWWPPANGDSPVHVPAAGTPANPTAGGTQPEPTSINDKVLEQTSIELELRQQVREARETGKGLEADKLQSAADAVRDERIKTIREHVQQNGGFGSVTERRSMTRKVMDTVRNTLNRNTDYQATNKDLKFGGD